MLFILFFILSFLLGSIPTGYLLARTVKKVDIRTVGSGNVGATNVTRALGKRYGFLVFGLDFLKGLVPVILAAQFLPVGTASEFYAPAWVGLGAILGHIYTPFLSFKGGKGIATGAGVVCASFPFIFALSMGVWSLTFIITRIVSISSLAAVATLLALSFIFNLGVWARVYLAILLILGVWTHRSNLTRLLQRGEKSL